MSVVTFDFGQTLTELDCVLLSERLAEKSVTASAVALETALPEAWRQYDAACSGSQGAHPWHLLMETILQGAGASGDDLGAVVQWLWEEQPKRNLWCKPIAGMIEVVRALSASGTKVGVISNSEGKLAQLAEQLGWLDEFQVIADSGALGFAKPGRKIFEWTGEVLGVAPSEIVHVGDSWAADVEGILAMGGRAIWFGGASCSPTPPADAKSGDNLQLCRSAAEVACALERWQIRCS